MEFTLENMCRTCMNEDGQMFSVFSTENRDPSNISYADMLMECASLHIDRNDDLPLQICRHCLKHLSIAYSFKQQSERCEATLREITKNPDIEFIKEEVSDPDIEFGENDDELIQNDSHEDDESRQQVSNEFRLTEDFLKDEYIEDQEIEDPANMFSNNNIKSKRVFNESDALETEFLEDEYILDDENDTEVDSKIFIDDNILVQNMSISDRDINVSEKPELYNQPVTPKSKPRGRRGELKCPYCDQTFRSQAGLKKHKKNHKKLLQCELCAKEFRSTHGLRYHMKIHNGIKNFPCTFGDCTKRFRLKQALDKHLSIHNNEKNHLCALCGKTYSTYDALTYHLRAHRGERPYLCIHCGKTFKQACHLKAHSWIHSGIKPHVCSQCGKCYTSSHQLKKHMMKHNTDTPTFIKQDVIYAEEDVEDTTNCLETDEHYKQLNQIDDICETHTAVATVIYG